MRKSKQNKTTKANQPKQNQQKQTGFTEAHFLELRGNDVKLLQQLLGIPADGIFGPKLKQPLGVSKANGLVVDGKVGPATKAVL